MKAIKLAAIPAGILVIFAAVSQTQASDIDSAIESCNSCHGKDGVSQWNDMPTIAGIDAFVHSEALYAYQAGDRPCGEAEFKTGPRAGETATMCEAAEKLSEAQVEALAEHYAGLPFVPAKQEFDPALAAKGKAIHDAECSRCHSDGGSNPEDEASILAGQWMGYLEHSFEEFASGERYQPDKMKDKMDALSEEQETALIHYYASQQ